MEMFLKVIAGVLTAVILWLCISRENKEISLLLSLFVCVMVMMVALSLFNPILSFIEKLKVLGDINEELLDVVFRVVGIGLISELSVVICKDAGNTSMAKAVQLMTTIVVIRISIPVFEMLLSLLEDILGSI